MATRGRPPTGRSSDKPVTVYLSPEDIAALDRLADRRTVRTGKNTSRPRPSEGQFFGQVGGAHFAFRCDVTKWGAFRPAFCRQEELSDAFITPFCRSTKCIGHVYTTYNS
jgi:hypothetical protein